MEYDKELQYFESNKDELKKLFNRIKSKKPKSLDQVFHAAHDLAFEQIDCLKCANCCKTTSPIFRDVDIDRIAKKFRQSVTDFEDQYLRIDEDGDKVLKSSPCPFLESDNKCFIYDVRPQACREYPHTDRKRMIQIMDLTYKNLSVCPAVVRVVKEVKKHY